MGKYIKSLGNPLQELLLSRHYVQSWSQVDKQYSDLCNFPQPCHQAHSPLVEMKWYPPKESEEEERVCQLVLIKMPGVERTKSPSSFSSSCRHHHHTSLILMMVPIPSSCITFPCNWFPGLSWTKMNRIWNLKLAGWGLLAAIEDNDTAACRHSGEGRTKGQVREWGGH